MAADGVTIGNVSCAPGSLARGTSDVAIFPGEEAVSFGEIVGEITP